jgi:hypothetical protein
MIATPGREALVGTTVWPSAVAWIDDQRSMVAMMSADGHISKCEISRGWLSGPAYVAQVVRVIGDRQRLVILGPGDLRLELEREYVALIRRRPDRLVDVEPEGPVSFDQLVDRLTTLAA